MPPLPRSREKGFEWELVDIQKENAKGDPRVTCTFCKKEYTAGATRIRAHVLGNKAVLGVAKCTGTIPDATLTKLKAYEAEIAAQESRKRQREQLEKLSSEDLTGSSTGLRQPSIGASFSRAEKTDVDKAVARCFYANGISFNVACSPFFKEAVKAIASAGPSYKPPGYEALRTNMLEKEKSTVQGQVEQIISSDLPKTGCTITSDGWSNTTNRPLLNFLLVSPKGEFFVKAVDTSGQTKDAQYIADQLIEAIEQIGSDCVVQVVTDNASNCKAAGRLVEQRFLHITWSGCVAHAMDLCLEDVSRLHWAKSSLKEGRDIVKFVTTHHKSLALFRQQTDLELLKPGDTRFATSFITLQRLLQCRQALEATVAHAEWTAWVLSAPSVRATAAVVKEKIFTNVFWSKMEELVALTEPIVKVLRLADSPLPTTGKIYRAIEVAELAIEDLDLAAEAQLRRAAVLQCLSNRKEFAVSDFHYAGYVLDPEFQSHGQAEFEIITEGFLRILEKLVSVPEDRVKCIMQLEQYRAGTGLFARQLVRDAGKSMPGYQFWHSFGGAVPQLAPVAIKVLSQPCSACGCERNWSDFDFIHSKRRNRLSVERSSDLVYVFSNLRLQRKLEAVDYEEDFVAWGSDSEED